MTPPTARESAEAAAQELSDNASCIDATDIENLERHFAAAILSAQRDERERVARLVDANADAAWKVAETLEENGGDAGAAEAAEGAAMGLEGLARRIRQLPDEETP